MSGKRELAESIRSTEGASGVAGVAFTSPGGQRERWARSLGHNLYQSSWKEEDGFRPPAVYWPIERITRQKALKSTAEKTTLWGNGRSNERKLYISRALLGWMVGGLFLKREALVCVYGAGGTNQDSRGIRRKRRKTKEEYKGIKGGWETQEGERKN